jgi:tight adherence protein C
MIGPLVTGAGVGLGVALIGYGLRPARPSLAQALEAIRRTPQPEATGRQHAHQMLAAPLARVGLPRARVAADLLLLQRDPVQHLAEQTAATLLGALVVPLAAAALGLRGQLPLWLALLCGAVGFRWADANLHAQAQKRREQIRGTLSALLDLLAISLAGGSGLEQALEDAAGICTGWAATRLRQVLATARLLRQSPWQALGELGADTAVVELEELAASMALAGAEGARVRTSLAARAAALRSAATTQMETNAEKAGERMSMPLVVLGVAYLIFLLYPPLVEIGNTL